MLFARRIQHCFRHIVAARHHHFGAELPRQGQIPGQPHLLRLGKHPRRFHINRHPRRIHGRGHAAGGPEQEAGEWARPDRNRQPLSGAPETGDPFVAHDIAQLLVHMFGRAAQRHFAQRGQDFLAEEILRRGIGALAQIHLALGQPATELLRRQIDQLDGIGLIQDGIRHGLAHRAAGKAAHQIHPAFEMLHIERGVDVNARVEQFDHILVALGVAAAGHIGMGQFIHQRQLRATRQQTVEVQFLQQHAAIFEFAARQNGQPRQQRLSLHAPMRLHQSHHHIHLFVAALPRSFQHGIRLAHARTHAKEDAQLPAGGRRRLRLIAGGWRSARIRTVRFTHSGFCSLTGAPSGNNSR